MNIARIEAELDERGWVVIDLPDPAPVHETRDALVKHLQERGPHRAERRSTTTTVTSRG